MALQGKQVRTITTMSAGKGDSPRPVKREVYMANYDSIFRKPNTEAKQTDEHERNRKTTIEQEAKPEAEIQLRVGAEEEPAPRQED